jgi:2-polyprenyl-6-methoxyphenol hydroxylase-like FAD-dependent oxidoreductase
VLVDGIPTVTFNVKFEGFTDANKPVSGTITLDGAVVKTYGGATAFDPGDVWTYACSMATQVGQTSADNTATATGKNTEGKSATASDSASIPLTQPATTPGAVTPGFGCPLLRRADSVGCMRVVVAGGGVAGLAAALAVARAGHDAVVLERDLVDPDESPDSAFDVERRGIPHYLQPHTFLPRGRRVLSEWAPDVLDTLVAAGAHPQDLTLKLRGPPEPGDEDLVYLWVRRPIIEWALRRAAAAEPAVELRAGVRVTGLMRAESRVPRATGVTVDDGEPVRGDVVVDALGRYRCPAGWPRADGAPTDSGAIYYCRYFQLREGVEHLDAPILNPRGDLGYMGFNTFRGDNRTFAVILLVPAADHELRVLRHERPWQAACAAIAPLDVMTSADYARPITDVMPMGGLMNVERTGDPLMSGLVATGDAFCHTDPAFAYGLSFALAHARALAGALAQAPDVDAIAEGYRADVGPEARERHALACATDAARTSRWRGEPLDIARRDGSYPLFSFAGALAAAPHDDEVLRRIIRRIGLLDRTAVFDEDDGLHDRIETILGRIAASPPSPPGPPRQDLLARLAPYAPGASV